MSAGGIRVEFEIEVRASDGVSETVSRVMYARHLLPLIPPVDGIVVFANDDDWEQFKVGYIWHMIGGECDVFIGLESVKISRWSESPKWIELLESNGFTEYSTFVDATETPR